MKTSRYLVCLAAAALAGCSSPKPPAELVGRWQRADAGPTGAPLIQRLNLKDDGKYSVSRSSSGPTVSDGSRTRDGLEILHSGVWQVETDTRELVLSPTYLPVAGVNTAQVQPQKMRSSFTLAGGCLTIIDAPALMLAPPGAPAAGSYGLGAKATGSVELQKTP